MKLPTLAPTANLHESVLACHPETPCQAVHRVSVHLDRLPDRSLALRYALEGDLAQLAVPVPLLAGRADGLWRHTCFEAFIASVDAPAYHEFNFSPSTQWAAYAFSGYRAGMAPLQCTAPGIQVRQADERLELDVVLPAESLPRSDRWRLGLSAVIEATDGSLSCWALRHAPGRPDFHHTDAFALEIAWQP